MLTGKHSIPYTANGTGYYDTNTIVNTLQSIPISSPNSPNASLESALCLHEDFGTTEGIVGHLKLPKFLSMGYPLCELWTNSLPFAYFSKYGNHPQRPCMVLWCCMQINSCTCLSEHGITNYILDHAIWLCIDWFLQHTWKIANGLSRDHSGYGHSQWEMTLTSSLIGWAHTQNDPC